MFDIVVVNIFFWKHKKILIEENKSAYQAMSLHESDASRVQANVTHS